MTRTILAIILAFLLITPLHAKDYALIKKLPQKLTDAQGQAHKGWDTGVTPKMVDATYRYNDTLIVMINELVKAYYPKDTLEKEEIHDYLKALYTIHRFKQNAENPSGEFQGTITYLDVPSAVSEDLETTISEMVEAITDDDAGFDYKKWKEAWKKALKP